MNLNIAPKMKRFVFQNATAIKNVLKVYFVWQMGRVQISVKITIIVQEDKYVLEMEPVKVLVKHQLNVLEKKFVIWINVFVDRNVLLIAFVNLDIHVTTEHGKIYPHLS